MVPLAPWEKVFIDLKSSESGFDDVDPTHAVLGCAGCHGGTQFVTAASTSSEDRHAAMELAHTEMIRDPSAAPEETCGLCHTDIVERNEHSMHTKLWGERFKVGMRAFGEPDLSNHPEVEAEFEGECGSCHTTCGQCHVSRPESVHGGFLADHEFKREPELRNNCTACHGSRIGVDYFGDEGDDDGITGNLKDVHLGKGYTCTACHNEDLHGDGTELANPPISRYTVNDLPTCTDAACHSPSLADSNLYHQAHWPGDNFADDISCYVCHSQPYYNCNNCHTTGIWKDGYGPVAGQDDVNSGAGDYLEYPEFRIGYNPAHDDPTGDYSPSLLAHADSRWVLVRHIPVARDTYDAWGVGLTELPENHFNQFETWEYTSPHNVRKWTAQTLVDDAWAESDTPLYDGTTCAANCHYHTGDTYSDPANKDIYLTMDYIENNYPNEIEANMTVMPTAGGECGTSACHVN